MKKSQLRQIIKEEIKRSLLEGEGDWKETFNSKIKTINPNDYTSATHLTTYIKQILTGTMGENSVNESMAVNTSTGEDITGHLIDYMEGKITREEFEELTGLTNLSTPIPPHMTDPSNSRY